MSNERLEHIKNWYEQQQTVQVEIPPHVTVQYNGTKVIRRFDGDRLGYKFVYGKSTVKREDLPKLLEIVPHLIIHDSEVQG